MSHAEWDECRARNECQNLPFFPRARRGTVGAPTGRRMALGNSPVRVVLRVFQQAKLSG